MEQKQIATVLAVVFKTNHGAGQVGRDLHRNFLAIGGGLKFAGHFFDDLAQFQTLELRSAASGLNGGKVEQVFNRVRERTTILGAGFSALAAEPENVEPLTRLALALGL